MSQATRATSARARANIAAAKIREGQTDSRTFDDCFEMGDGDIVVAYLMGKATYDGRIGAMAIRCGWTPERYPKSLIPPQGA
jgi:hypothetical protein